MIKYVELTAPEASAYRQAKVLSIECQEGDYIKPGDTLFLVQSGNTKLELPSTTEGRIIEFIVNEQENITLSTPLLLLETTVDSSTATPPIQQDDDKLSNAKDTSQTTDTSLESLQIKTDHRPPTKAEKQQSMPSKKHREHHEQQSLDLLAGLAPDSSPTASSTKQTATDSAHNPKLETTENNLMPDTKTLTIDVPDIGAESAKVIEILVSVGDQIATEDALVTLESDKASMDVPSPYYGTVKSISVSIDQDVSEGTTLIELEASDSSDSDADDTAEVMQHAEESPKVEQVTEVPNESTSTESKVVPVVIPDIGGDSAKVVDILVTVGDTVEIEDALVTLESDKASMDVPSSSAGVIETIDVAVDDDVSEGSVVVTLSVVGSTNDEKASAPSEITEPSSPPKTEQTARATTPMPKTSPPPTMNSEGVSSGGESHASPSIRRFARELGVDLSQVIGTGRKKRVTKEDVKAFVKGALGKATSSTSTVSSGAGIPAVPAQDFSKFGDVEVTPLNKIKKLTASNLHRSWLNVPHVTHNDEAKIDDLEAFRKQLNAEYKAQNKAIKLSPLAFIVKAVVSGLQTYPQFNSSLEPSGDNLILKKYFNIGIAVDTPNGLVVPVIKNADTKSVAHIAQEMGELAHKAREKKLTMNDMSGACFTISSLGGIGGTSFTPIVNAPEVAILGVSRSKIQPVWNGKEFIPGMMLPLSLSYDHRVIDGAEAARFTRYVAMVMEDIRRLTV